MTVHRLVEQIRTTLITLGVLLENRPGRVATLRSFSIAWRIPTPIAAQTHVRVSQLIEATPTEGSKALFRITTVAIDAIESVLQVESVA